MQELREQIFLKGFMSWLWKTAGIWDCRGCSRAPGVLRDLGVLGTPWALLVPTWGSLAPLPGPTGSCDGVGIGGTAPGLCHVAFSK